jgi:hypothetical protein
MKQTPRRPLPKTIVIVTMMVTIALLHFVTGSQYRGPFPLFMNGYLIDILLPFGLYFLLCLNEYAILKSPAVRGSLIFTAASFVELAQYRGIPLFGRTFDPWDIIMYGLGVLLAVFCDQFLFPRLFPFWQEDAPAKTIGHESEDEWFVWRNN